MFSYSYAEWVDDINNHSSTSSYIIFFGLNSIAWSSKKQHIVAHSSSTEAEYSFVANVVIETTWVKNLLLELHTPLKKSSAVYCDNVGVTDVKILSFATA